jgi:hypothetical protein
MPIEIPASKASTSLKFCADCHYSRNRYGGEDAWLCEAPLNRGAISLVTGSHFLYLTCKELRSISQEEAKEADIKVCGVDGNWFKSRSQVLEEYKSGVKEAKGMRAEEVANKSLSKLTAEDI